MINPKYFTDEKLKTGCEIILESHKIIHATSILTIIPVYPDFANETGCIKKVLREMATIHARLLNQYKLNYHMLFSASFYNTFEEDQKSDEIDLFIKLNRNHKLAETDINKININEGKWLDL